MKLLRPPDLPAELEGRYERVAARLADLDLALPPPLEPSLARVALASDFVLRVLLRWPELLVERLGDAQPLDAAAVAARLKLDGFARGAGDDGAAPHAASRDGAHRMARHRGRRRSRRRRLREVSLLAECSIQRGARLCGRRASSRASAGRATPAARSCRCSCSAWASSAAASSISRPTSISCFCIPTARVEGARASSPRRTTCGSRSCLIKLLDQRTEDGFAYRVDTRLRPFGGSGPLVREPRGASKPISSSTAATGSATPTSKRAC